MKMLMLVATMVLGATSMCLAQTSASTDVNVDATVIQGLTLNVSGGPLSFGTVVAGTTPAALSAKAATAPMFTATGDGGHAISVSYGATVSLNGPGTALTFTPSIYGANSSSNQAGSTAISSGSQVNLSGSTGSAGNYYYWLGGVLDAIPSGQTPGSYQGTFTLTVNYP